jgi:hypothetical protein
VARPPRGPAPPPAVPLVLLGIVGLLLVVAGGLGVFAGLTQAARLRSLLPVEAIVDAPAVGGAVFALGVAAGALGLLHLGLLLMLKRRVPHAAAATITLSATLAVMAAASGIAAAVSAVSRMGDPGMLTAVAAGLLLLGSAYAWAARVLIGAWNRSRGSD